MRKMPPITVIWLLLRCWLPACADTGRRPTMIGAGCFTEHFRGRVPTVTVRQTSLRCIVTDGQRILSGMRRARRVGHSQRSSGAG